MRGEDAAIGGGALALGGLEHDGAGAVAEEDASRAVVPIENARESLRTDHQGPSMRPRGEEFIGRRQREDESRTDRLQIEGDTTRHAESGLDLRRDGGKGVIGGRGRNNDEVDVIGGKTGVGERRLRGAKAKRRGSFVLSRDVALPDAGALHDPGVGRVERFFEIGVAQNARR